MGAKMLPHGATPLRKPQIQHKFIEQEARNAVLDMILRAEEIAYQNELRRIEQEQMAAEEEEESAGNEALDESRDKFE